MNKTSALFVVLLTSGCVIPTVSLHSSRNVEITLSEAESGKPVASMPFRVHYESYPADSPIFYHLELRSPSDVCAKTDESGKAVVKLADYAWSTLLDVKDTNRHYFATFLLSREVVRKGGLVEQLRSTSRLENWGEGYPELRLELQPGKSPTQSAANGRQPSRPESVLESPAAASRRSP